MTNNITNEQIINAFDTGYDHFLLPIAKGKVIQNRLKGTPKWSDGEPLFLSMYDYRVKPVEKTMSTYLLKNSAGHHYNGNEDVMRRDVEEDCESTIVETHTFTYTEEE